MDTVTDQNTVAEIKAYLDAHNIAYSSSATKADLLALVPAQEDGAEPTDTTSETPSDDTDSGDESTEPDQPAEPIKVSSFDLDKTSLSGEVGGTEVVTLSNIQPTNATDKTVEAVLDDGSIVSVQDNGDSTYTVSFLAAGSTTIHWSSRDDGATLAVPVTVTDPVPTAPELKPWEIMLINHDSTPHPAPPVDTYTVQAGETLADIATAHMMSLARLKKLNGLTINVLPAGRVIRLS
ncbi:LysM peptidoglycan-binding domain-containing protein [Weissella paramesenteroides]|nr:LysM peptidoglycan-binding domain-containing protein [Weissella paramesenteroides]KAA8440977.1 LysM peptidoglycan-binding domain-containing protein [Weissella paramesenteroides]KAA8443408.1 LysM peptidoglycan-binding domain-containing protein [Weissella paramesenteroides]KAA8447697.1 LysM peptidoglycan-binding domain-containing protein [Weissella paramesenteroides]KAA8449700.1 LysM peptidoglycan-binding domain-containing protein [Weissella paramesenteroides]